MESGDRPSRGCGAIYARVWSTCPRNEIADVSRRVVRGMSGFLPNSQTVASNSDPNRLIRNFSLVKLPRTHFQNHHNVRNPRWRCCGWALLSNCRPGIVSLLGLLMPPKADLNPKDWKYHFNRRDKAAREAGIFQRSKNYTAECRF